MFKFSYLRKSAHVDKNYPMAPKTPVFLNSVKIAKLNSNILDRQEPTASIMSTHSSPNNPRKLLDNFSKVIDKQVLFEKPLSVPKFLLNEKSLRATLYQIDNYISSSYIHDHFISWLSAYAKYRFVLLSDYFDGKKELHDICNSFIKFCFEQGILLDPQKTLEAFAYHNQLSDNAVKMELLQLSTRNTLNLLGFGLDEGHYEKHLAQFLIEKGIAQKVNIYGFDPYATKKEDITYLTKTDLANNKALKFDLITARWVLHHVALKERWPNLITCINKCEKGAAIVFVEHGILREKNSLIHKKISDLLNATFDIVANMGLRPHYFTSTAPNIGTNFFIHYLEPKDFDLIRESAKVQSIPILYDVGPGFPNQTICCLRVPNSH